MLTNQEPIQSSKPFPDESNREGIEQMLLHAFEFAIECGLVTPDGLQVEDMPVAGFPVQIVTMKVQP